MNAPRRAEELTLDEVLGMAPQSTATNGPDARGELAWTERASTSFPVPVSPSTSSVASVAATRSSTA